MNATQKNQSSARPDLQLAFDVGHSSIGWAVLQTAGQTAALSINILGCGAVTFRADDCLASARRGYRRQRRHIRSTRQRIARMKILLQHLGVLTETELDKPGCAWPWKLAAQVLKGGKPLTWPELWDVLRWYAHNRGYDGNRRWSNTDSENQSSVSDEAALDKILNDASSTKDEKDDAKKVLEAKNLMRTHNTYSMAETFCKELGIDPLGQKKSSTKRFKGLNAAFPRKTVEGEVLRILQAHKFCDAKLIHLLCADKLSNEDRTFLKKSGIRLPKRFEGGLLFGQLVPRFDNRIISTCPITYHRIFEEQLKQTGEPKVANCIARKLSKVPSRNCKEFLNFRWAMQLANIRIACVGEKDLRPLTAGERKAIDQVVREKGGVTPFQLKLIVRERTQCVRHDLEQMLMLPDFEKALLLDPVQKMVSSEDFNPFWKLLPVRLQKRLQGKFRHGKVFSLAQIRKQLDTPGDASAFETELQKQLDAHNTKVKTKDKQLTREQWLQKSYPSKPLMLDGRAAFSRHLLKQAYEEVMAGNHPKGKGGCLFIGEEIRLQQVNREIVEQTNNHLVRHRLLILAGAENPKRKPKEGLLQHIIKEYAGGKKERIGKITIEVNRDLREMSGKDSKAKEKEMRDKLGNIRAVEKYLLDRLPEKYHGRVNGTFLRKARIADDLDWRCPYTGEMLQPIHLITGVVDLDHIIPYSVRPSNSLDSLVTTFSIVNKMKGKRTAMQFMKEMSGKPVRFINENGKEERVTGMPNLTLLQLKDFKVFVEQLKIRSKSEHQQDKDRRLRRKKLFEIESYEEKEFLPRDLTQTSQLVRLGAEVLRKHLPHLKINDVISLPGSVTGSVRKNWKLEGCLSLANRGVIDENGHPKTKTEIRDITHLHHALDACVLGIATNYFPNQKLGSSSLWELLSKRKYSEQEKSVLRALGLFKFDVEGRGKLTGLPAKLTDQISKRLAEKRVVQHLPSDMSGLAAKETVWRVFDLEDKHPSALRLRHWFEKIKIEIPPKEDSTVLIICRKRRDAQGEDEEKGKTLYDTGKTWRWVYMQIEKSKLLGFAPVLGIEGKLKKQKGVKIIGENFGMALFPNAPRLSPKFEAVRMFNVCRKTERERLREANGGKFPDVLRKGHLIRTTQGSYAGQIWRILSVEETGRVRFCQVDIPRRVDKPKENFESVMISSLMRDGLQILRPHYTGISVDTLSS